MEKRPIAIIVAMKDELNILKNQLEEEKEEEFNGYTFYEGKIQNYPIVICHSKIMTINATIATLLTIEKYHPIAIINEGTAGGHSRELNIGDIIIGEKVVNIVSSKTAFREKGKGSNSLNWELVDFLEGEKDKINYQSADTNLINIVKNVESFEGKVKFGIIGSGDIWNKEYDRIMSLNKKYGTLCEDMESIAVYTVANKFNTPVIGIKVVANNEILGQKFQMSSSIKVQDFCYKFVEKIIEGIK